ncbi:sugar porter family MFS transporter [Algoriphagus aestuariicola]|uniref:Sugar porter family MFS transporter n=1 Tax=Algoriphagus aestuariicola TaxID=1852016 RepID=A0ABS3BLA1_9BACT|nr:sugar porter family MFS transporter [Algoriphagus aestuariicola]MBN7800079.1 sugar porter family MFS transporter [Algoriphagus aestuariicola]
MAIILSHSQVYPETKIKYNRKFVYLISAVVALGGILFGFDLVIISGTVPFFTEHFGLSEAATGWAVGCINLGAAVGALAAGKLSAAIGRKKVLLFCSFLFAVTGVATGWAGDFTWFIIARLSSGIAVGIAALVCPMYIAEVAPAPMRGRLVSFYQLAIVSGLLLAYFSNYLLLDSGINNWRWMFSSQAIPATLFFFGLFLIPESPRWLIKKGIPTRAQAVLSKIGGKEYGETEARNIQNSFLSEVRESLADLFKMDVRHIVFIGAMVAIFSQAGGQNSIFSFAPVIFQQAGVATEAAFFQSVIIGLVNFIFTFFAIYFIDKIGRRKLLLYGSVLLCLDALALAFCFFIEAPGLLILIFVLGFIGIYSATLGPVTWVILSEIFPNRIRSNSMALATLCLWIANFFTTASFPILKSQFGLFGTFAIHAGICFVYFLFVKKNIPETKGKSLEEIEIQLIKKHLS